MNDSAIRGLLQNLMSGQLTLDTTVQSLCALGLPVGPGAAFGDVANTIDACVDTGRAARCGFPEVVYGEGKTPQAIVAVF